MSHRQLFASGETIREQKDEIARLQAEIERLQLTDAERQAIKEAADAYEQNSDDLGCERIADTLHGLLDRMSL